MGFDDKFSKGSKVGIGVLIVDRQEKRGRAIKRLLEHSKGVFRVSHISAVSDLSEAPLIQKPDVVLVSLSLETPAGAQLLRRVQRQFVGIPIIILSPDEEEVESLKALQRVDQPVIARKGLTLDHLDFVIQQSLIKHKAQLHKVLWDEATTQFVQMVSHELRTPLSIIKTSLDTLLDMPLTQAQRIKIIQVGLKSVERLWMIVQDQLDLSSMEKGTVKYSITAQKIDQTMAHVVSEVQDYAQSKNIRMINYIDSETPEVLVDLSKLRRIVSALVHNAIKFTPTGGKVTLTCEVKPTWVEISVSDTGIGIGKGHEKEIFQKYRQITDGSQLNDIGGIGLGLVMVKKVVEAHQGKVWVESQIGKGTNVTFTLPLSDAAVSVKKKAA